MSKGASPRGGQAWRTAKLVALSIFALGQAHQPAAAGPGAGGGPPSLAFREYRLRETTPTFGLNKVRNLIAKVSEKSTYGALAPKEYHALSVAEKFTYCMIHWENFSQNCAAMPLVVDEGKKLFAYYLGPDEKSWSKRQRTFLQENRAAVVQLLGQTILAKRTIGVNLKDAISETRATELIPLMESTFSLDPRDKDILTVLMLLMKNAKYAPFLHSPLYSKLYGDKSNYQSAVAASKTYESQILQQAQAFFRSRAKS